MSQIIYSASSPDIIIRHYFNSEYTYLCECAKNILKRVRCRKDEMINDLVSETFIYLDSNKEKLSNQLKEGMIESIAVNYMNKQVAWSQTAFKKNFLSPNDESPLKNLTDKYSVTDIQYFYSANNQQEEDSVRHNLPRQLQSIDKDEEEHIYEEMKEIDKYNLFVMAFEDLPVDKRILFNLIFRDGYNTTGKLHRYFKKNNIKESSTSCYYMLRQMRDYFSQKLKEYNNKNK